MAKWYIVKGMGPSLDGKVVYGKLSTSFVTVERLVDKNIMFGDRELSFNFPHGSILIHHEYLHEIDDPNLREYDSKNPWGKFICEGRSTNENIEVAWAEFKNCVQVTVREKLKNGNSKTLFSDNFTDKDSNFDKVIETVQTSIRERESLEDLIFALRELKNNG